MSGAVLNRAASVGCNSPVYGNMDEAFLKGCQANNLVYQQTLDRIIEKYSKFHDPGGDLEVDLDCVNPKKLYKHLKKFEKTLSDTSKSLIDLEDSSNSTKDITVSAQQLNSTLEDGELHESPSSSDNPADFHETTGDGAQLSLSSLEEHSKDLPDVTWQPEEQDQELQMSLNSNGSFLMDVYPNMVNRIEQAWHRQHASNRAHGVLRRYRRWRNRSSLNKSFAVSDKSIDNKAEKMIRNARLRSPSDPARKQLLRSPAEGQSPPKAVNPLQTPTNQLMAIKKQRRPIYVMDFSAPEISLNETFSLSEESHTKATSHTSGLATKASMSPLQPHQSLLSTFHSAEDSSCTSDSLPVRGSVCSPVRQSPWKSRLMASPAKSAHSFNKMPAVDVMDQESRKPMKPRMCCPSLSSPSQKPPGPSKILTVNSQSSFHQRPFSPHHSRTGNSPHWLKRNLSFDSTPASLPLSPQQVDQEFRRVFHKFVCMNKSSTFRDHACSLCVSNSENRRNHSSSVLAALALSPHCSSHRKRDREVELCTDRQSKRLRAEFGVSSPGSKRLRNESLRRRLYPAEPLRGTLPCYSSDTRRCHNFTTHRYLDHVELRKQHNRYTAVDEVFGHGSEEQMEYVS